MTESRKARQVPTGTAALVAGDKVRVAGRGVCTVICPPNGGKSIVVAQGSARHFASLENVELI